MPHILSYFKNISNKSGLQCDPVFVFLITAILVANPLNYAFGSITSIIFIGVVCLLARRKMYSNVTLLIPIVFYILMIISLLWSINFSLSLAGLRKEGLFLMIPLAFVFMPPLREESKQNIFRFFSFGMGIFSIYYIINASLRYFASGNDKVFFYHELVTQDRNAIYVSVFISFAMFYFIIKRNKSFFEQVSLVILIIVLFLLSSKSIIFIDFMLIICYYSFFSMVQESVKLVTITTVLCFLLFSVIFVKEMRERFLTEYETAFVDNTLNKSVRNEFDTIYNVSIQQAWNNQRFQLNNFFPGTAMRVYQARIFQEMLVEDKTLLTGYGLEASQSKIRQKAIQHNLYQEYGEFNFHNQYIQTFAELGVLGFLILILMLWFNFKKALKNKNFLHIVFAVTMIILFLTESFFCRQRGIVFFITMYCVFNSGNLPKPVKKLK